MTASGEVTTPHPRRIGLGIAATSLGLLSITSWWQPVGWLLFGNNETAFVLVMHVFGGTAATAAMVGALRRRPWAWAGALAYGVILGTLVAALGPVLDLPAEERKGLWVGALACLLIGGGLAWYLRRALPGPGNPLRAPVVGKGTP